MAIKPGQCGGRFILWLDDVDPQDVEEPKLGTIATARPGRPRRAVLLWGSPPNGSVGDLGGREVLRNLLRPAGSLAKSLKARVLLGPERVPGGAPAIVP
jgi:hypothetical protein